jgi:single-strand DNA-binding protein
MPLYLNTVSIGGYLGRDPELTTTKNGTPKLKFSVGVNNPGRDKASWIDCLAWAEPATQIARMCRKGQAIIVVGILTTSTWTDQNGMNHKNTEIVVDRFNLVGDKPSGEKPGVASVRRPTPPISAE